MNDLFKKNGDFNIHDSLDDRMSNKDLNDELIHEATRIADDLEMSAKCSPNGVYWRINSSGTYYQDQNTSPELTLYLGVGGILLFLLEMYRARKEDKYLSILHQCASWIYRQSLLNQSMGFYGGRFGTVYTLLEIFKTTGKAKYTDWCHEMVFDFKVENSVIPTNNLHNGIAGELLGLTHMLSIDQDSKTWNILENNLKLLIDRAKTIKDGIYWDDPFIGFNNLSFINGNLGIAYALTQLWNLTGDKNVYWLLSKVHNFLQRVCDKFERKNYSWNFSRELIFPADLQINESFHRVESVERLSKTFHLGQSDNIESGLAGDGLFALEIFKKSHDKVFLETAHRIAYELISRQRTKNVHSQTLGLFNGTTGIGYFFLKLVEHGDSIINPAIRNSIASTKQSPIVPHTKEYWLSKSYPYTISLVKQNMNRQSFEVRVEDNATFDPVSDNIRALVSEGEQVQEIYNIESAKTLFEERYLFIEHNDLITKLISARQKFDKNQILACTFNVNPYAQMIELTSYGKKIFQTERLLVCSTTQGSKTYHLNNTDILILEILKNRSSKLSNSLTEFKKHVEFSNPQEETEIDEFFINQLKVYALREIITLEEESFWRKLLHKSKFFRDY
jgi:lantibiotic modifying enzyme